MWHAATPLVLTDAIGAWPALGGPRAWASVDYLLGRTFNGHRLVPVEVGRSYVDSAWGQAVVSFRDFAARWLGGQAEGVAEDEGSAHGKRDKRVGYLAQHNLFAQIPALARDMSTPDLCFADPPPPPPASTTTTTPPPPPPPLGVSRCRRKRC